jgi:hypothetical protein
LHSFKWTKVRNRCSKEPMPNFMKPKPRAGIAFDKIKKKQGG